MKLLGGNEAAERPKRSSGPQGLGDPDDESLRKVELEVLIPKKMREKARAEKCFEEVSDFNKCCRENGLALVVKCQAQNDRMKTCLGRWYNDEGFRELCRKEYLKERSEYRLTGITKKQKEAMKVSSSSG